jgi:polyribonucleotide nucleotidyltransferase
MQRELQRLAGQPKVEVKVSKAEGEIVSAIRSRLGDRLIQTIRGLGKQERSDATDQLLEEALDALGTRYEPVEVKSAFDAVFKDAVRASILRGERPDGRKPTEVRPLSCQVSVLPRTHGSSIFQRGETQVLGTTTLGPLAAAQKLDTLNPEDTKRFLHHYNFPPYSVGEARRVGSPGRREIGHGALAERALEPVIPSQEDFPYAIRLVSDILGSNGSTSMGSVCAGTLSMMDAGVPIKAPVAGIAMGLVTGANGEFVVLTDIQGVEDALGDMDFKVAGTAQGVTALQMDIKLTGITDQVLEKALDQAREARLFILDVMRQTIAESRPELSRFAPRMTKLKINPDRIGALIGPGGKTIRGIIEETKATIDVENDGTVYVGAADGEAAERAIAMINRLTRDITVGEVYTGKVVRTTDFGAFVELAPGRDGMVHISELANYRVPSVEDVVKVGDEVQVLVTDIDPTGRIRLSRKALLQDGEGPVGIEEGGDEQQPAGAPRFGGGGGGFRPRDRDRGPRPGGGNGRPPRRGPGGPPPRRS